MTQCKDKQPAEKPPLMGDCVMAGYQQRESNTLNTSEAAAQSFGY